MRAALVIVVAALAAAALALAAPARADVVPWCGTGEVSTDQPDAVNAYEWHVIYALPSDAPDKFSYYAPRIAGDVQAMTNWWLAQDPTRRPRFDLLNAPGCASDAGRVDITFLRLPGATGTYTFDNIESDVRAAGFDSPDKAYLVYFDGTIHAGEEFGVCGQGHTTDGPFAYVIDYLQTCQQSFDDATRATVATHELLHGLGAVPLQAPHTCSSSPGHVCDSPSDLMKPVLSDGDSLANLQLDVGRDDYYGHTGDWWDTRESSLLYELDQSQDPAPLVTGLTATSVGTGVVVRWSFTTTQEDVQSRIYDTAGHLVRDDGPPTYQTSAGVGQTVTLTVRTDNPFGFLSPPATIRFKVGYGIVDSQGNLVKDTVPPAAVAGLRARRAGAQVVVSWAKVADPIGIRGYRVTVSGQKPVTVAGTSVKLALAKARGKLVQVAAVDEAGNLSTVASVRAPR